MFEGKYTTIGTEQTLHPRVFKNQLNQNLGKHARGHFGCVLTKFSRNIV